MKHAPADRVRLARWHEYSMYAVVTLLTLSGAVWLVCRFFLAEQGEYGPMPHGWEGPMMTIHGAAAMLTLFFVGSLLTAHMIKAWLIRRNRWSGGGMAALSLVLAATGYGLYYVGDDTLRGWVSWAHWVPGVFAPFLLGVHVYFGSRNHRRRSQRRHESAKPLVVPRRPRSEIRDVVH